MWRFKSICFLIFLVLYSQILYSQNDNVGSGRAVSFNGTTDYIDFGDRYSNLVFPFTVSAWVYLRPSTSSSPIFVSRNNNSLYNGFWFMAYENYFFIEYGDGFGGNNPAFRRGKRADVTGLLNRWNHITAVVKGTSDIELYLNGVNVGGYSTGNSSSPMVSNVSGGHSTAGYFLSNGITYKGNPIIDDIRLWNRSLSQEEIRQTMCINLQGNESGLIGYWDFNEISGNIVYDKSPNKFNGQFVGNPERVFSGAPIGDVSTYKYSTNWSAAIVSHLDIDHKVDVKNIIGSVSGVQIYEIKSAPSQTTGLDLSNTTEPYFGIFLVSQSSGTSFDVDYYFTGSGSCDLYLRDDNSKSVWAKADNPLVKKSERGEILKGFGSKAVNFDLGSDKTLCDNTAVVLSTQITDDQFTFQWNTGETTSSILVEETGLYSVSMSGYCGVFKDSIKINFQNKPKPFSLGEDNQLCVFESKMLQPVLVSDLEGLTFLWQDGSTSPTFKTDSFGEFWVTVRNDCGQESDTVTFSKKKYSMGDLPNVITPNGDSKNDYFFVDDEITGLVSLQVINRWGNEVYYSSAYQNKWAGEDLASGVYYIVLEGSCIEQTKSFITIIR